MTDNSVQPQPHSSLKMRLVKHARRTQGHGPWAKGASTGKEEGRTAIDLVRVDPAVLRVLDDSVLLDRRRDLRRERLRTHRQRLAAVAP